MLLRVQNIQLNNCASYKKQDVKNKHFSQYTMAYPADSVSFTRVNQKVDKALVSRLRTQLINVFDEKVRPFTDKSSLNQNGFKNAAIEYGRNSAIYFGKGTAKSSELMTIIKPFEEVNTGAPNICIHYHPSSGKVSINYVSPKREDWNICRGKYYEIDQSCNVRCRNESDPYDLTLHPLETEDDFSAFSTCVQDTMELIQNIGNK